jgi:hypothetical protein
VRARIELHRNRIWLEIALAIAASAYVTWVLLTRPDDVLGYPIDRFTLFPLSVGVGAWLPLLARTRRRVLGSLRREGDALVIEGGLFTRRIAVRRVRGARVTAGRRGASLLLGLDDGTLIAAAVDDVEDAQRLAEEIRRDATAGDEIAIRSTTLGFLAPILRVAASSFALAYYLFVVRDAIPGSKAFYGLSALFAGMVLLVIHLLPRRREGLGPTWDCTRGMRAHLRIHARTLESAVAAPAPRPRLAEHGEPLGAWLSRLRREIGNPEAYRGAAEGIWARVEHAYRSTEVPLRERALALRILAKGRAGEVKQRIAELEPLPAAEQAWLEEVALAEDDEAALARVDRRPPDFAV